MVTAMTTTIQGCSPGWALDTGDLNVGSNKFDPQRPPGNRFNELCSVSITPQRLHVDARPPRYEHDAYYETLAAQG